MDGVDSAVDEGDVVTTLVGGDVDVTDSMNPAAGRSGPGRAAMGGTARPSVSSVNVGDCAGCMASILPAPDAPGTRFRDPE